MSIVPSRSVTAPRRGPSSALRAALTGGALFLTGSLAHATPRVTTSETSRDVAYVFEDDPLGAVPNDARGTRIRARKHGVTTLLIRPRLHFIVEIEKSAEDL